MRFVCTRFRVLFGVSLVAIAMGWPHLALAQDAEEDGQGPSDDGVQQHAENDLSKISLDDDAPALRRRRQVVTDEFAPQGVRLGTLLLFPTLEIGGVASSNAARSTVTEDGDVALRLKPGLRLESDWSRHQLTANASGEMLQYLDNGELSSHSADLQTSLRLDVRHNTRAILENGYTLTSTGPSDSEVPNGAIENRLSHSLRAAAAVEHDAGAGTFRLRAGVSREIFEDVKLSGGGVEDNADRDFTELALSLRGTFNEGAVVRPFVEVAYTPRIHDRRIDRNGLRRNSHGLSATAGLQFSGDPVWSGEIAATIQVRDYEDAALATEVAPGLLANLQWRPTELTTVDLTAGVALAETSSATDGASASWTAGATLTQALRENLDAFGSVSGSATALSADADFELGTRAGLEWKMNPLFSWSAAYEGSWLFADAAGGDYVDHRLIASIILKR